MEITKEQFMNILEAQKKTVKKLNTAAAILTVASLVGLAAFIVSAAAYLISDSSAAQTAFLTSLAVSVIMYLILSLVCIGAAKKYDHISPSVNISALTKKLRSEYCTNDFMSWASGLLRTEKNILNRGYIRNALIDSNFFRGEFDIAFRTNIPDNELFQKDRAYELYYLKNVMLYQYSAGGDLGAAENAYRAFNELYSSCIDRSILTNVLLAVDCEVLYSMMHGDWERAIYYIDILAAGYEDQLKKRLYGITAEYAANMTYKAEALLRLGHADEARALMSQWAEYLRPFPYRYNKAMQLLNAAEQGGISQ
ncbi:MAG: hypothetical protein MR038_02710 [Oscillospiraceae bacterium]|nr:hypothetical protein [Oscillospiraceae bacterium]